MGMNAANPDEWLLNLKTKEVTRLNDLGGDEMQIIQLGMEDSNGGMRHKGTVLIEGSSVYSGPTANGMGFSSTDYWSGIPSGLTGHNDYQYDTNDLKMRHQIMNSESRALQIAIHNSEASGRAEQLTGTNYWNTYGETLGKLNLFFNYFTMMNDVSGSGGFKMNTKHINSYFNRISVKTPSLGSISSKPNFTEFNQFRTAK